MFDICIDIVQTKLWKAQIFLKKIFLNDFISNQIFDYFK